MTPEITVRPLRGQNASNVTITYDKVCALPAHEFEQFLWSTKIKVCKSCGVVKRGPSDRTGDVA